MHFANNSLFMHIVRNDKYINNYKEPSHLAKIESTLNIIDKLYE